MYVEQTVDFMLRSNYDEIDGMLPDGSIFQMPSIQLQDWDLDETLHKMRLASFYSLVKYVQDL